MQPLAENRLHATRREFFGRAACGAGTAALAWLLNRDGLAAGNGEAEAGAPRRADSPACRTSRPGRSTSSTCSRTAPRPTSSSSTTSRP